jgi:hypothetical protein
MIKIGQFSRDHNNRRQKKQLKKMPLDPLPETLTCDDDENKFN